MRALLLALALVPWGIGSAGAQGADTKKPPMPDWKVSGWEVTTCCCQDICPCRYNEKPTHMECESIIGVHIDKGNFGSTRLDGVNFILVGRGLEASDKGWNKLYVDQKTTPAQQQAVGGMLASILSSYTPEVASLVFGKESRGMKLAPMTFTKSHEGLIREVDAPDVLHVRARLMKAPNSKTPVYLKGVLTEFSPIFFPAAEIDARVEPVEVPFDHPVHHRAEVEDFTLTRQDVMSKRIGFQFYNGRGGCLLSTQPTTKR